MTTAPRHSAGLGLVEMMVAITIGLIIMAAVSTLLVTNKITYTTQDALSRLQENARVALQFIEHDIRLAGYFGCGSSSNLASAANQVNTAASGISTSWFDFANPIEGSNASGSFYPSGTTWASVGVATTDLVSDSDAFALRFLDPSTSISLTTAMPQQSASMDVTQNSGVAAGDILMVTDCSSADLFQVTNFNTSGGFDHIIHNTGSTVVPGNVGNPNKLNKSYGTNARIMRFVSVRYYVKQRPDGVRALYRQLMVTTGTTIAPVEQELVEGVEDMQVTYGVDTTGDRVPDKYLFAGQAGLQTTNDWANVVSVRVGLLLGSLANTDTKTPNKEYGTQVDSQPYLVNGTNVTPPALRRDRRIFLTTITVRNRK